MAEGFLVGNSSASLYGLTATVPELNTLSGVSSNVQQQLDDKMDGYTVVTALPASGSALAVDTVYDVSAAVNTYQFVAPSNGGWAHGSFRTGTVPKITFGAGSKFLNGTPKFLASRFYEFDVVDGVWVFGEQAFENCSVTTSGTFSTSYAYITYNGVTYSAATTLYIPYGDQVAIYVSGGSSYKSSCYVQLNGTKVQTGDGTYTLTALGPTTIAFTKGSSNFYYAVVTMEAYE